MPTDGPIERLLEKVENAADEELESHLGVDADRLDELDELLAEYRDELQAVHDEFQERLADAGFDGVLDEAADDEPTTPGVGQGRDGSTGPYGDG